MDGVVIEQGQPPTVKVEETEVPEQHGDIGISTLLPETGVVHDSGEGNVGVEAQTFQFDENTLKTLQQFMESQAFQATANIDPATGKPGSSLAAEIAQHYLPTRLDTKPETEDERKARLERVRLENRERKKKWREQNADRNKDNDLRCRVNKRANLIYGTHPSPQKTAYIENEFRKRRQKRKGKQSSPDQHESAEGDMYSGLLNNPEFTNVLMGLLAQKGVEVGDKETTNQLVELLKSNPEFLRSFLSGTGAQEHQEAHTGMEGGMGVEAAVGDEMHLQHLGGEMQQAVVIDPAFHEPEANHSGLPTVQAHFGDLSMDSQTAFIPEQVEIQPPLPEPVTTTAPIPQLRTNPAVESTQLPSQATITSPVQSYPTIPIPPPFMPSAIIHPPPPPERIQAFGFPPRMGQSQR